MNNIMLERYKEVNCTPSMDSGRYLVWFQVTMITLNAVAFAIISVGIVSNILIMITITKFLKKSIPYQLMVWIAINDNFRLYADMFDFVFHLLELFKENIPIYYMKPLSIGHAIDMVFEAFGSNASKYILTQLTILQYISISRPFFIPQSFMINLIAAVITLVNLLIVIPHYYLFQIQYCASQGKFMLIANFNLIWYYRAYAESFLHPICSLVAVIFVSILMIRAIRKSNRLRIEMKSETLNITRSVLKLNLIFVICNIPYLFDCALLGFSYSGKFSVVTRNIIIYFADLCTCINSSVRFMIYMLSDKRFKHSFKKIFHMNGSEIKLL